MVFLAGDRATVDDKASIANSMFTCQNVFRFSADTEKTSLVALKLAPLQGVLF